MRPCLYSGRQKHSCNLVVLRGAQDACMWGCENRECLLVQVAPPASMQPQSNHSHGCVDLRDVKGCWGTPSPCRVQDSGVGSHCTLQPLPDPLHHAESVALLPGRTLKADLACSLLLSAVLQSPVPSCTQGLELSTGHLHPAALGYHL